MTHSTVINNHIGVFKPITDQRGTHIRIFIKEPKVEVPTEEELKEKDRTLNDYIGEDVGLVTYHVSTHSITVGNKLKEGYAQRDIALIFVSLMKGEFFKNYVREVAGVSITATRPVWCKQLNMHFR